MCAILKQHAEKIALQLAVSKDEVTDIADEFTSHLLAAKFEHEDNGMSEKEAIEQAINEFGEPGKIAEDMHEAIFPYQKLLFFILSIVSLAGVFSTYLASLFLNGDAYYIPLILTVLSSSFFLILSTGNHPKLGKLKVVVTLLIIHTLLIVNFSLIAANLTHIVQVILSLFMLLIILYTIFLIYYTVLTICGKDIHYKLIHFINMTLGFLHSGYLLFLIWGIMVFAGEFNVRFLIFVIPITIWGILYFSQTKALQHAKIKTAYLLLIISCFIPLLNYLKFYFRMSQL